MTGLDGTKYIAKNADLLGTAKATLKNVETRLYSNILNSCETVPAYRAAYATAGEYSNPVVENLLKYEDDLTYIQSKSPDLAKEAISEVAQASGKSSEELKELAREIIDEAREKAEEVVEW